MVSVRYIYIHDHLVLTPLCIVVHNYRTSRNFIPRMKQIFASVSFEHSTFYKTSKNTYTQIIT
jgi:hypothetical protein